MIDLCIKDCRIVCSTGIIDAGIAVDAGKIVAIAKNPSLPKADETINARGKYVMPGMIDAHVHIREGMEEKEDWLTGSSAAAAGGVTTILSMPNTKPPNTSQKMLELRRKMAARKSVVNFGFHLGATPTNMDEISCAKNIASVKVFMCKSIGDMTIADDKTLEAVFKCVKDRRTVATVHAEDQETIDLNARKLKARGLNDPVMHSKVRDNKCAVKATSKVLKAAVEVGNRMHLCHVSTLEEIPLLAEVKKKNQQVSFEVTPHHLFLTEWDLKRLGNYGKTNPSLKSKRDAATLWNALERDVDLIASDHAPHLRSEKEEDYWRAPSGVPGLETTLPLMLNAVNEGRIAFNRLVELVSENPARVFRIIGKGFVKEGFDADLTLIDLKTERRVDEDRLFTKCKWTPFNGIKLRGWPVMTLVNGRVIFEDEGVNNITASEVVIA